MSNTVRNTAQGAQETGHSDAGTADFAIGQPLPGEFPPHIGRYRIERLLGMGGFGMVFLACDEQLGRLVAIKVPHARRLSHPEDAAPYLNEARNVASLDHPHVVPVYDVGSTPEFPCFVVSKFIEGTSLSERLKQARYSWVDAVEMVVALAEALHYAHRQGLVHRDVKPGNILIDKQGQPYVVDFGLALRDEDVGANLSHAGTPAYMSPEQARGEGHRVDGRSDIFSLGVVLYELLTGRRPFQGPTREALLVQITTHEPKPPRQIADSIPRELERICLRALAKRATDRYTTALDFADDLRHLLSQAAPADTGHRLAPLHSAGTSIPGGSTQQIASLSGTAFPSTSQAMRVVPKGLRSFDEHDADFFLELLPGPRDRNGLPDSIRFWKSRIEENSFERTFTAGLIYGPSGCGKSSLVKAGLLPRLSENIISVYVEATPEETEQRLLNKLRKCCPTLSAHLGLKESLLAVRLGHEAPSGRKLLIILDQFEQWLHARKGNESGDELVEALRQCDGVQVQCLVLVRDDFYVAVNRFFQQLEVPILEGHNYSLVDLFDRDHARKVLIAFGRAYGRLPESSAALTTEQQIFLSDSVAGLAQEGKVISVRLALFAEMMKGRTWTPASLREVGGPEGVGATFLEETFAAQTAPPTHRLHQPAVRAVLKALLPDAGTDIKGQMQPSEKLLDVSGYAARPDDFRGLLSILENDVRLIAPAEPPGATADQSSSEAARLPKYYQLTHDFLIPAVREWLGRKQKETRRGRAELQLAERAALWSNKRERKQFPSWWEWLNIRLFTNDRAWTETERRMMRLAGRHHLVRIVVLASLGLMVAAAGVAVQHLTARQAQSTHVNSLVTQLWKIDLKHLPQLLDELEQQPDFWRQDVATVAGDPSRAPEDRTRAHLALARSDSTGVEYLRDRLLETDAAEHQVIRDELKRWKEQLAPSLWRTARDAQTPAPHHLRVTATLADYDPESPEWNAAIATPAVHVLVNMDPLLVNPWAEALRTVRKHLLTPLADIFLDSAASSSQRLLAASVIARFAADDEQYLSPDLLCELVMNADAAQNAVVFPVVRMHRAQVLGPLTAALETTVPPEAGAKNERQIDQQANAAETLLRLDHQERIWPLLKQSADPRLRTALIDRIAFDKVSLKVALDRLDRESEGTIRQAIVLGLDALAAGLSVDEINRIADKLADLYLTDPDGGVHSGIEWVLGRWGFAERVSELKRQLAGRPANGRKWFVNSQLQTMLIIDAPGTFKIGSPEHEPTRDESELWRDATIVNTFAISAHEVTVEQFERPGFAVPHQGGKGNRPAGFVKWFEAVQYCRWLSDREGIHADEQCYPESIGPDMRLAPDYLTRTGYRLPTPQEWEYAARAGSMTSRFFGNSEGLLEKYARYGVNSGDQTGRVGQFRPSPLGLFDVYGNVSEWCDVGLSPFDAPARQIRGGGYRATPKFLRSAMAAEAAPDAWISEIGFRIVKTVVVESR